MEKLQNLNDEEIMLVSGGIDVPNYTPQGDIWDHGSGGDASYASFWGAYRFAMMAMNYQ